MDYAEISVDPKFHRHLIGKGGVNSKYRIDYVNYFGIATNEQQSQKNKQQKNVE